MVSRYDSIVIGASPGGLAAAAYLSQAGQHVLVLESAVAPPEPIGPLAALDPHLLADLKLSARGLRFVNRDLPLALPGLVLGADPGAALGGDARGWGDFRHALNEQARLLRGWWAGGFETGVPGWMLPEAEARAGFDRLCMTGADAWLSQYIRSDALIAALLFDATAGGLHVSEPGSALALVWRAAQEVAGRRGVAAMAAPGTLLWSLIKAAGGADFRCNAKVARIRVEQGRAAGVTLTGGELLEADHIFSSLPRAATQALLGEAFAVPRIGEARLMLSFRQPVAFPAVRLILAERSDVHLDAHEAAWAGRLPAEVPMELAAAGPDRIAVTLRPVPARLSEEDRLLLAARAVRALSRHVPGSAARLRGVQFAPLSARPRLRLAQLLAPAATRIAVMPGLSLCGADAEPVPSLSGRAARLAALAVLKKSLA